MLLQRLLSEDPVAVDTMNNPSCVQSAQQDTQEERNELEDRVHQLGSALKVAVCELKRLRQREKVDKDYNTRLRKVMDRVVEDSNERQKTFMAMQVELMEEKKKFMIEMEKVQLQLKSAESEKATLSQDNEILRKHILELTAALSKTRGSSAVSVESTTHLNSQAEIRSTAVPQPCAQGVTPLPVLNRNQWQGQSSEAPGVIAMQCIPTTSFAATVVSSPLDTSTPQSTLIIDSAVNVRLDSPDVAIISPPPQVGCLPPSAMFPVQASAVDPAPTIPEEAPDSVPQTNYFAPCWEPGGDTVTWWSSVNGYKDPTSLTSHPDQQDIPVAQSSNTSNVAVIDLVDCCSDVNEDDESDQQKPTENPKSNSCSSVRNRQGELPTRIYSGGISRFTACEKCGKFMSVRQLSRHNCTFKCQECKKTFADKSKLASHQRTHSGHKQFTCDVCRKSFQCSSNLNEHMQTHKKDHRQVCKKCGKSFSKTSHPIRQTKAVHDTTQPRFSVIDNAPNDGIIDVS